MKDFKKKDTAVDKLESANDFESSELNDELDRLARTFQEELEKAKADAELSERMGELIQGIEDEEEYNEEDYCQCCGERKRDKSVAENYEYCSVCREAMRHYPLSASLIAVLTVMVVAAIVSVMVFVNDFTGYDKLAQAEKAVSEQKLFTALENYDEAIASFEQNEITAKKAYYNSAKVLMNSMPEGVNSMSEITSRLKKALGTIEAKMPVYDSYNSLSDNAAVLSATLGLFYETVNSEKYGEFDGENEEMYAEIMTAIGALTDSEVMVKHIDGTSTKVAASEPIVRFAQYMFAYATNHLEDAKQYLEMTAEIGSEYKWMYAYELGCVELQTGSRAEAEKCAKQLYESNIESPEGYTLYSSIERMKGNTDKAIEWADKGLAFARNAVDLYRMKGMAYIVAGEYEKALAELEKGLAAEDYGLMYFTYAVVLNELGKTEELEKVNKQLEEYELEYSDRMNDYFAGKLTAKQLFTEGTGDVE